jgi:hypothetical protein
MQRFHNVVYAADEHSWSMPTPDPHAPGRAAATADDWRRGFAEPDLEDEEPPRRRKPPAAAPAQAGAGVFGGADDHGVITVTVDRSGLVADVLMPPTWRDTLEPRELGHALLTAANKALNSHLADHIEHLDLDPDVAAPTPTSDSLVMSEVADLFARFDRDLEFYRDQLDAAVNVTASASGPNGRVRVTMTPGRVTDVSADARWAARARYTEIRAEALKAFQAATRDLGNPNPSAVPVPATLARLQELAGQLRRGDL